MAGGGGGGGGHILLSMYLLSRRSVIRVVSRLNGPSSVWSCSFDATLLAGLFSVGVDCRFGNPVSEWMVCRHGGLSSS